MKIMSILFLLALLGLAGACKKDEPVVLLPTSFSFQMRYKQTGLPVDSGVVKITGVKGSYLQPPVESRQLYLGYTDRNGRLSASINVPSDNYAYFSCYKFVKTSKSFISFNLIEVQPYTDELKRGKENNFTVVLDTLK